MRRAETDNILWLCSGMVGQLLDLFYFEDSTKRDLKCTGTTDLLRQQKWWDSRKEKTGWCWWASEKYLKCLSRSWMHVDRSSLYGISEIWMPVMGVKVWDRFVTLDCLDTYLVIRHAAYTHNYNPAHMTYLDIFHAPFSVNAVLPSCCVANHTALVMNSCSVKCQANTLMWVYLLPDTYI